MKKYFLIILSILISILVINGYMIKSEYNKHYNQTYKDHLKIDSIYNFRNFDNYYDPFKIHKVKLLDTIKGYASYVEVNDIETAEIILNARKLLNYSDTSNLDLSYYKKSINYKLFYNNTKPF